MARSLKLRVASSQGQCQSVTDKLEWRSFLIHGGEVDFLTCGGEGSVASGLLRKRMRSRDFGSWVSLKKEWDFSSTVINL